MLDVHLKNRRPRHWRLARGAQSVWGGVWDGSWCSVHALGRQISGTDVLSIQHSQVFHVNPLET